MVPVDTCQTSQTTDSSWVIVLPASLPEVTPPPTLILCPIHTPSAIRIRFGAIRIAPARSLSQRAKCPRTSIIPITLLALIRTCFSPYINTRSLCLPHHLTDKMDSESWRPEHIPPGHHLREGVRPTLTEKQGQAAPFRQVQHHPVLLQTHPLVRLALHRILRIGQNSSQPSTL